MVGSRVRRMLMRCGVAALASIVFIPRMGYAQRIAAATHEHSRDTQRVTVSVEQAPLTTVLRLLAKQAGLVLVYDATLVPADTRVSLHVQDATVDAAFQEVLRGTGLIARVMESGTVAIVRDPDGRSIAGSILGTVVNSRTKQPLPGANVTLDDSVRRVTTDTNGRFQFTGVAAGSYRITVRVLGYTRQTKVVTVADDQTATVAFGLEAGVNTLDQVVVTATGSQRYRELGHVVAKVDADSLVREAPITSVSELLTARVPGLLVTGTSGATVGGDVALRLRGTTTTSLDPQPIVVVDGVRYKSSNYLNGSEDSRAGGAEPRSPLNDLNVNDIETVEVVKGPSASTLYGPDAANGVIVITTKRGKAGKPQWRVYAYPDLGTLGIGSKDARVPDLSYQGWGHIPGTDTVYQGQCTLQQQAFHQCVLDSLVVVPSPANDPQTSIFAKNRPQWHSGLSVSGGTSALSYFFSGNLDAQTGALQVAPIAEKFLEAQLGVSKLPDDLRNPNTQKTVNLHANLSTALSPTSTIGFSGNYTQATQRAINIGVFDAIFGASPFDPGRVYTSQDSLSILLGQAGNYSSFFNATQMDVSRLTVVLNGGAQPLSWLTATASVGADLDNTVDRMARPVNTTSVGDPGEATDNRRANINRTVHLGLVSAVHPGIWSVRTSFGVDYNYTNLDGLNTDGTGLAPGSTDITTATSKSVQRLWTESVQLGGYGEEVIGLRDRLFLTGSLRLDGSTTFGDAYAPRPYPKVGVSWVLSDEPFMRSLHSHGLDELRLRYSYGAASRYPTSEMKWGAISAGNALLENSVQTVFDRYEGANPTLRPERSREAEYGADATLISVIRLGLTWYNRRTIDELQRVYGPQGLLSGWENIGDFKAHGFELTAGIKLLETASTGVDLNATYAYNTDVVSRLGPVFANADVHGGYAVGYPLGAAFGTRTIGYADTVGGSDGIITGQEIISSPQQYLGTYYPPRTYTVTPVVTLLGGRIRVSSLFDRQSGGVEVMYTGTCRYDYHCAAVYLKSTPLLQQAINLFYNSGDFVHSSDFTRWRELNVTGDLPLTWRERLHLSRASASVQLRNLALWTPTHVPDPETVPGLGSSASIAHSGGATNGAPMPRTWTIRFDIAP